MNTQKRRPLNLRIRNLIGFSALVMLGFVLIVAYQGSQGYNLAIQEGRAKAESLTSSLADHAEITFLTLDMTLRRAIERQYINEILYEKKTEYTMKQFSSWINETPQVAALALIDDEGRIRISVNKPGYDRWIDKSKLIKGNDLFEAMRSISDQQVFIGLHQSEGSSYVIMARRFSKSSGDFGGIVVASLTPDYFRHFYGSIATGAMPFMAITLQNARGNDTPILTYGPQEAPLEEFRRILRRWQIENVLTSVDEKGGSRVLQNDDSLVIIGNRRLKNLPIVVYSVLQEDDILFDWRNVRTKDISFLTLFILFGSVLSLFAVAMAKHIARAEKSENAAVLASQAKSEFLANMSHELRTPLNAIIGYSEMINAEYFGPLNEKQKDRINDINLCGAHLLQLINDILEFSKGEAGKLELMEEEVDLAEVIGEGARISHGRARTKNIRLLTSIEPGIPLLWADRRKVTQILLNLLTNAIKFTPEGGTIRLSAGIDASKSTILTVSDTGIGMDEADIPKALSVFGQVHRNKNHEGTGLGLPLCKMFAELHGGKLELTSKKNEGTTVRIIFPHQRTMKKKKQA